MKLKRAELIGRDLDIAVARAANIKIELVDGFPYLPGYCGHFWTINEYHRSLKLWSPSTKGDQANLIIELERIAIIPEPSGGWRAQSWNRDPSICGYGPTAIIAAMRCFLLNEIGEGESE